MQFIIFAIISILIFVISYYNYFELTTYALASIDLRLAELHLAMFLSLVDKQEYPKVFNCIS